MALGIIAIMITVSQAAFFGVQRQRRANSAKNNFIAMVREARSVSLQLGSASGSPRVTSPSAGFAGSCPIEFQDPLTGGFRAGMQINMNDVTGGWRPGLPLNTPGHNVISVTEIRRVVPGPIGGVPQLPRYDVRCKSFSFPSAFRNSLIFNRSLAEGLASNRLTLTFDSRGSLSSAGPPGSTALQDGVVEVPTRENIEGTGLTQSFRDEMILVFASGFSCLEHSPGTLRCRD